jgi:hypothetical protein
VITSGGLVVILRPPANNPASEVAVIAVVCTVGTDERGWTNWGAHVKGSLKLTSIILHVDIYTNPQP